MSGKVSDLPIRYKRTVFTQKKLDRINFRSGNGGRVLRNPPGVTRCWSRVWSHDSLSHGIDKMADPVMLSIFGVQLLMFVQVVSGGLTTGPLVPGPQARELQGAP